MRLIDADRIFKLLKEQEEKETGVFTKGINKGINIAKCIIKDEVQSPTVYDIEKVVAELKEWTFNADINLGDGTVKNSDLIASKNAIEIVKRGGVSDNDVCEWKYNDEFEFAKSECGAIDTHRIAFRKLKFCPYCGKKIKVVE